jgi:hypothetical protein
MEKITEKYNILCSTESDINEHLPTLYNYDCECESILELGVIGCVSSWALTKGLLDNNKPNKKILLNDINSCDISELLNLTNDLPVDVKFQWINDLELNIEENVDLTFIDTWHIYGQLKRELDKFSKVTNKYIIMHDTTIDGEHSECVRSRYVPFSNDYSNYELVTGLWKAIEEFLDNNPNWKLRERFINNCGLTVLERI